MFRKILIANRGEIALRIVQACRELGIPTLAVFSTADRSSLHVTAADEAVCIGPAPAAASYLDVSRVLSAAEITGADAVHPGYGFLAENPLFAEVLQECGLSWIGPAADTMRLVGDKARARRSATQAGVPVLPGSEGVVEDPAAAEAAAADIGYPVLLKAAAGGGGRGLRRVEEPRQMRGLFLTAREEAYLAFGDGALYVEKYLPRPRHIEFQIFGDTAGTVLHLGERECSIQRRHQKLLEESPAPGLDPAVRDAMAEAALRLSTAVGYVNAGTVEFLLDEDGKFYFLEMNSRLQVEHPVTEAVTGVDLVKQQILVAAGERLDAAAMGGSRGHAIECRINAEHPETFVPSPGVIAALRLPGGPGVRIDTHAYAGYEFPPYYDSLMAKVVALGRDREEAVVRMQRALESFLVEGIHTTIPVHLRLLRDPGFRGGHLSTRFLDRLLGIEPEVTV